MTQKYKVSAKRPDTGKWWTFGNMKTNQYGNQQIGLRVTPELRALVDAVEDGGYINFSLFEDNDDKQSKHNKQKADGYQPQAVDLNDEIPF